MTRQPLSLLAALFLGLGVAAPGHATQILHWKRLPLAVPLTVGQERIVFLDRKVRVGIPTALSDRLRIQSTGGKIGSTGSGADTYRPGCARRGLAACTDYA